ncbi:MAG: DNA-directed RNA polymerase subunit D [Methanosarcinales archaeon]|nr:MAG: DNA-directed RNA polymerase subunit D [Methanosarcinales archaeon]
MNVDIIELSELKAKFVLSGVSPAFANALRRSMIIEVPSLAIDDVNIYENMSVLFDEVIALRLGLIPLKTDLNSYVLRSECKCEDGCPKCQVSLMLSVEGPKTVYSGDLQSSDPKVVPAEANIPIVKLKKDQKLVLEAIAILGKGKDHAKWQPAVACGYKNMPKIVISGCDGCGACVDVCPIGILELDKTVIVKDEAKCSLCRLCEKSCESGAIKINTDPTSFVFSVEVDGSMLCIEAIIRATDEIKTKAKALTKNLSVLT